MMEPTEISKLYVQYIMQLGYFATSLDHEKSLMVLEKYDSFNFRS